MVKNVFIIHAHGSLLWRFFLLWIYTASLREVKAKNPIYIGGFFPLSPNKASVPGYALLAAAQLALEHVNTSNILKDYELKMIIKDSQVSLIYSILYQFVYSILHPTACCIRTIRK